MTALLPRGFLSISLVPLLAAAVVFSGCSSTGHQVQRTDTRSRVAAMGQIGVTEPGLHLYELTAAGNQEKRDDWTHNSRSYMTEALAEEFARRQVTFSNAPARDGDMEEITALYGAITASIITHIHGPTDRFERSFEAYDFNVGAVDELFDELQADSLLLIYGFDEFSTGGRKALMVAGVLAGAVTGVAIIPRGGIKAVSAGLIDRSGEVIWHNILVDGRGDLRTPEGARRTVTQLLSGLPIGQGE
jgi:hypothetical protein